MVVDDEIGQALGAIKLELAMADRHVEGAPRAGLAEARARGKLRLEGKEYILQDGEIMHVRFNI